MNRAGLSTPCPQDHFAIQITAAHILIPHEWAWFRFKHAISSSLTSSLNDFYSCLLKCNNRFQLWNSTTKVGWKHTLDSAAPLCKLVLWSHSYCPIPSQYVNIGYFLLGNGWDHIFPLCFDLSAQQITLGWFSCDYIFGVKDFEMWCWAYNVKHCRDTFREFKSNKQAQMVFLPILSSVRSFHIWPIMLPLSGNAALQGQGQDCFTRSSILLGPCCVLPKGKDGPIKSQRGQEGLVFDVLECGWTISI